jgi:hypothetical protein
MMAPSRRAHWLSLAALTCAGCQLESGIRSRTQVVVDIDADRTVRDRTDHVQLSIAGAAKREQLPAAPSLVDRTIYVRMPAGPHWPLREVLTPQAADASRVYSVRVTALDERDRAILDVRVESGYVHQQIRSLELHLTASCLEMACADDESCFDDSCQPHWRSPYGLPQFSGSEDDIPWANSGAYTGRDAGRSDGGRRDAGRTELEPDDAGASERDLDAEVFGRPRSASRP